MAAACEAATASRSPAVVSVPTPAAERAALMAATKASASPSDEAVAPETSDTEQRIAPTSAATNRRRLRRCRQRSTSGLQFLWWGGVFPTSSWTYLTL